MQSTINRDIWLKILEYFSILFIDDNPGTIRLKRGVMLSIVLMCRGLAEIALGELWKAMTTLGPIVRVFRVHSVSIAYTAQGYWVSTNPILAVQF